MNNIQLHKRKFLYSYISGGITVSGYKWARNANDVFQSLREYEEHHYRNISRLRITEMADEPIPQLTEREDKRWSVLALILGCMIFNFFLGIVSYQVYHYFTK